MFVALLHPPGIALLCHLLLRRQHGHDIGHGHGRREYLDDIQPGRIGVVAARQRQASPYHGIVIAHFFNVDENLEHDGAPLAGFDAPTLIHAQVIWLDPGQPPSMQFGTMD
ncbi:hypothetical protein HFP05_01155 [Rhodanobacter denitrificans]|nr:hypothetical protein [Rhodanobacter denitrificans]